MSSSGRSARPGWSGSQDDETYIAQERWATTIALLQAPAIAVLNRPIPGVTGRPVFTSLDRIGRVRAAGFELPPVLVTSRHEQVAPFFDRYGERALVGSLSGDVPSRLVRGSEGRRHTHALLERHPIFLEAVPAGRWLQVFTVGEAALGAFVETDVAGEPALARPLPAATLPPPLAGACVRVARSLGLGFAQIRLVEGADGRLYCLDVDACPDYGGCVPSLQEAITVAVAAHLLGEERSWDDPARGQRGRCRDGLRGHTLAGAGP